MPSWNSILEEEVNKDNLYNIRKTYLKKLYDTRKRNIISYYSGWLQKGYINGVEINDNDKNSFM